MKKLIVMSGVPGSGKSYFSQALRKKKKAHVYIISSDALRDVILGNQQDLTQDSLMWKMYYRLAEVYSEDPEAIVVLDATFSTSYLRIETTRELRKNFDVVYLISYDLPKETILRQNEEREWPIPQDDLSRLFERFQLPNEDDKRYFDKIFVIKDSNIKEIIESI